MLTVVTRECFVGFMGNCELATRGRRWLMINPSPARLARISRDLPDGWATSVRTLHGPDPATGSAPSIKGRGSRFRGRDCEIPRLPRDPLGVKEINRFGNSNCLI